MITHFEAAMTMSPIIERGKNFLRDEGFLFPAVYVLTRNEPLIMDVDYSCVVNARSDEEPDLLGIYKSVVALESTTYEGKSSVQFVAEMVARKHNPDIIGIYMMGLYKKVARKDADKITLQMDPEALQVLHLCFYQRGNKDPMMVVIPYLNRGPVPKEDLAPSEIDLEGDGPYDISFVDMPWTSNVDDFQPLLKYPFCEM